MNKILYFKDKYKPFSNFFPAKVIFEDITFPTVEHAYVAAKTLNISARRDIAMIPAGEAGKAKRKGRYLVLRTDWEKVKFKIMEDLLRQKFSKEAFKNLLLETKDSVIIEGNYWHDNTWGDCLCSKCQNIPGQNRLGKLLMEIRRDLERTKSISFG